jgi:hypothetical protein
MLLDKNACEEAGLQSLLDENTPHRRSRRGYQRSVKSRLALVEVEIRDLALRLGRGTWIQCTKYTKIDTNLLVAVLCIHLYRWYQAIVYYVQT